MAGSGARKVPPELSPAIARIEGFAGGERAAVLARMVHAVADLAESCDPRLIREVAGADSNDKVLFEVLKKAPPARSEAWPPAGLRGALSRKQLLEAEGGTLSAEEMGELLGMSRQAVDKRRRAGRLFAVEVGPRGLRYPAWQVHDGDVLAGLEEVLTALTVEAPLDRVAFFLTPSAALGGRRPLDLLRRRARLGEVVAAAQAAGGAGA